MFGVLLAVTGATAVALALSSRLIRNSPVTEPLVALVVGLALGPQVLGLVDAELVAPTDTLGNVALTVLAVSVMSAALRYPSAEVRALARPVVIMVALAPPVMAATSAALTVAFLAMPTAMAVVIGATLAPTDTVLVSNALTGEEAERDVPTRIRALVSLESGWNDGLAVGFLTVAVAATGTGDPLGSSLHMIGSLVASVLAGALVGGVVGRLLVVSERHHDIEHTAFLVLTLSLVALVLGAAEVVGGEGIVAVFAAGLAYAHQIPSEDRQDEWEVQEAINRYLVLPVFILFGIALPWSQWADLGWQGPALALSVVALRRVPVLVLMRRLLSVTPAESAFMGWAGPVGVGSIYLLTTVAQDPTLDDRIWPAGTLVVAVSIAAHGLTATGSRRWLVSRY